MIEANFQANSSCPVCHEKKNISLINISSPDNFYLEAARTAYNLDPDIFEREFKTYKCGECGSIYCNPWFSRKTSYEVFNLVYAQHNRGWEVLYDWLDGKEKQSYKELFRLVQELIGTISTYGELNCPFQGNFLWMSETSLDDIKKRKQSFQTLASLSGINRLEYWMRRWRKLAFKINRFRLDRIGKQLNKFKATYPHKNPKLRLLITTESTKFWGQGCFSNHISCRALASAMLGVEVAPLSSLNTEEKLDCIGVFNVLDHLDNPLETLLKLLEVAKFVLLVNHGNGQITKQHHFVLRSEFTSFLENKNLEVINLKDKNLFTSDEKNKDQKIILLISKKGV